MSRSRAGDAPGSAPGYVHAASGYDEELARLRLLQARYDARTFARLTELGSLAGAVCLEVGAGAGSRGMCGVCQGHPASSVQLTHQGTQGFQGTVIAHSNKDGWEFAQRQED